MGPLIHSGDRLTCRVILLALSFTISAIYAQTLPVSGRCVVTAVPSQVRSEGLTERMGDIILQCSGSNPGAVLSGNLSVFLPISITNRVDANNQTHDAVLSVDYGSGFVPTGLAGLVTSQIVAFNGVSATIPPSGNLSLKVSNIRADVNQLGSVVPHPVQAQIIFSSTSSIPVDQSTPIVAYPQTGLFATLYSRGITCVGSPLPSTVSLPGLFAAGTALASTRVTEGFAGAFQPRSGGDDNGTRFLVSYSGFPANTHLYLADLVAGSDAGAPTSGGDLGATARVGQYLTGSGTLLLARVIGADSNGAGGAVVPLPSGDGTLTLNSASEVPLTNGSGFAVYEVIDANPAVQESAQFPTFIGLTSVTAPAVAQETLSLAPVSTIRSASAVAPVPRFAATPGGPPSDCSLVGDCAASYFPKLSVLGKPTIELTAVAGGDQTSMAGYIPINNAGGGVMNWTATVNYVTGTGFVTLSSTSGVNYGSVVVTANARNLAAGTYQANVVINAREAGVVTIPVTLTVAAAPLPPPPTVPAVLVSKVVNAATFDVTPLVAGSLGTLMGSHLSGKTIAVTFDGLPATLLYSSDSQINLQVPDLGSKTSAILLVTVDGSSSAPLTVALSPAWPAVFAGGILNQGNSVNSAEAAAQAGSILQIFATGIPAGATVSVQIGSRKDLVPLYAGAAPTVPGVQQVNVAVPGDLTGDTALLVICAVTGGQQYCSAGSSLAVQ